MASRVQTDTKNGFGYGAGIHPRGPSPWIQDTPNQVGSQREDWQEGADFMSRKAKRILALLNDPRQKNRLLEALNKSTLDEGTAPVAEGGPGNEGPERDERTSGIRERQLESGERVR